MNNLIGRKLSDYTSSRVSLGPCVCLSPSVSGVENGYSSRLSSILLSSYIYYSD